MKRTGVRHNTAICLLLIAITLAAYWPVFHNGFIDYDDPAYITENAHVQSRFSRESIAWAFSTDSMNRTGNWHPLTWMSLMLDHSIYGLNPFGYHLTNLLLHTANALLLFVILLLSTGSRWRSALVAALFAVHPLHVESVAWAAERKDVLSCLFGLLAILAYIRYTGAPSAKRYLPVLLMMILSLMAKPMLVSLPILLLMMDFWPLRRFETCTARKLVLEKVPLLVVSLVFGIIAMWSQGSSQSMVGFEAIPIGIRAANAAVSYVGYLARMLWPRWLTMFYPHPGDALPYLMVFGSAALLIAITAAAVLVRLRHPSVLAGWLWYLVSLLPVIGLVQIGRQGMADRYTYIPLIGIFVLIAWTIPERASRIAAVPIAAIIGLLMLYTWQQVGHWRDSTTLLRHAIAAPGDNSFARQKLAGTYESRGNYSAAAAQLRVAVRLAPGDTGLRLDLADNLIRLQRLEEAEDVLGAALRHAPHDGDIRVLLNRVRQSRHRGGRPAKDPSDPGGRP